MLINCSIIADDRERIPKEAIKKSFRPIKIKRLDVGDYSCGCGKVGIERKENDLDDMSNVLRQVEELKQSYEHPYLVVTRSPKSFLKGSTQYAQRMAFIASLSVRGVPPIFLPEPYDMIEFITWLIVKHHDGKVRSNEFNPIRQRASKNDRELFILQSLPGVGPKLANNILADFGSVWEFFIAHKDHQLQVEGMGDGRLKKIRDVLGL